MPIRPNFSIGQVVDPTQGLQKTFRSVGDMIQSSQDQALKRQAIAQDQANKDRAYQMQKVNADRVTSEFDRKVSLRDASADIAAMQNPVNAGFEPGVQDALLVAGNMQSKEVPGMEASYNPSVAQVNNDLYGKTATQGQAIADFNSSGALKEYVAPTLTDNSKTLQRDPLAFEREARAKLTAQGFTGQEADPIIASEMARRYPVASQDTIKLKNDNLKEIYKQNMGILKKRAGDSGSGMTIDPETGQVSFGTGSSKTRSNEFTDPKLLKSTIDDLSTSQSFFGRRAENLGWDKVASTKNLNSLASRIKSIAKSQGVNMDDFATAGVLPQLVDSSDENFWRGSTLTGDNLDVLAQKGVDLAILEGRTNKSNSVTTKGGGSGGSSTSFRSDAKDLTDEFNKQSKANLASGLRGTASREDIANLLTPQAPTAPKEGKGKGGTGKDLLKEFFTKADQARIAESDQEFYNNPNYDAKSSTDTIKVVETNFSSTKQDLDTNTISEITKNLEDPTLPAPQVRQLVKQKEEAMHRIMLNNLVNHGSDGSSLTLVDIIKGIPEIGSNIKSVGKAIVKASIEGYFAVDKAQGTLNKSGGEFIRNLLMSTTDKQLKTNNDKIKRAAYDANIPNTNPKSPKPSTILGDVRLPQVSEEMPVSEQNKALTKMRKVSTWADFITNKVPGTKYIDDNGSIAYIDEYGEMVNFTKGLN
jgi:hypothetical protein